MSTSWMDIVPTSMPSFGGTGHTLGFYLNIAHYIVIIPVVILLVVAVVYNVFVGLATKWMYENAWDREQQVFRGKKSFEYEDIDEDDVVTGGNTDIPNMPPGLPTSPWEEIFIVNFKIAKYLLGETIQLTQEKGYLVLTIHDYHVFMPLGIIYIQLCQVAIAMMLVVLFVDFSLLSVTNSCLPGVSVADCFDANEHNTSALPLDCNDPNQFIFTELICFHLSLNPIIGAAVVGGFVQVTPQLFICAILYVYLEVLKITHRFDRNQKLSIIVHVITVVVAEIGFIGAGLIVLIVASSVKSIREVSLDSTDPLRQMTLIFLFVMYFVMAGFVWCVLPLTKHPQRFQNSKWKLNLAATKSGKGLKGGAELRPLVVVNRSLSTENHDLLTNKDD